MGKHLSILFKKIILFLAVLGLHCYAWAFSSSSKWGLLCSCGVQASHCGGFSCCRAWALGPRASVVQLMGLIVVAWGSRERAQWLWCTGLVAPSMSDLPGPGIKPVSPALARSFFTTGPPEKSQKFLSKNVL